MNKGWERWLVGTFAVAIVAAGSAWILRPVETIAPLAQTSPVTVQPVRPTTVMPAPAAHVVPEALLASDAPPVGVQVEQLLASGDPQQAYTAYLLVAGCDHFNKKHDLVIHDQGSRTNRNLNEDERRQLATMCGAMTERERLARLDHLAVAIKAGVPGAAIAYAAEGPFGDPSALTTRPDDPLVRQWKATAGAELTRAAEAGEAGALVVWGIQNLYGSGLADKQPVLGYGYLLANGLIHADRFGPNDPTAKAYADGGALAGVMGGALTPEQRAAALAMARNIAGKVKAQHRRGAAAF